MPPVLALADRDSTSVNKIAASFPPVQSRSILEQSGPTSRLRPSGPCRAGCGHAPPAKADVWYQRRALRRCSRPCVLLMTCPAARLLRENRGSQPVPPKFHCRTVSRSRSDGRCGEPKCPARGVRPVECTQKRTDIRHAKYEARTLAGRAATLPVRSQIERFGQTCDGEPATGQRADGLLAQDWQDALICIMSERLQTFTAGARA